MIDYCFKNHRFCEGKNKYIQELFVSTQQGKNYCSIRYDRIKKNGSYHVYSKDEIFQEMEFRSREDAIGDLYYINIDESGLVQYFGSRIVPYLHACITGTKEWFNEEAKTQDQIDFQSKMELLRESFYDRFSPEKLAEMSGEELLRDVFGNDDSSMMHCLMFDENYREFGSIGKYKYTCILYQVEGGQWKYCKGSVSQNITYKKALEKAEYIRDKLLDCVQTIEDFTIFDIVDYEALGNRLSEVFFAKYIWALKYYQMIFPAYFPCMYADKTIRRALGILGLPYHGNDKVSNCGELALFIRRCGINNNVFNNIYALKWGWDSTQPSCLGAELNDVHGVSKYGVSVDTYRIPIRGKIDTLALEDDVKTIEDEIENLHLVGEDQIAFVKVRINQGEFRKRLIRKYRKCCLCYVSDTRLLLASHIKPWAVSDPDEKIDVNNGLLLCPNHDKLFDQGLITFTQQGNIRISPQLDNTQIQAMHINNSACIDVDNKIKKYLKYHEENIFKEQE